MSSDAHNVDPITDLNQKISARDPSIVITDNPKAPPLPTLTPVGGFFNSPNITATVESVFERVKINGVSPTFKGGSIDFNLPDTPTISATPIISSVSTFQSPPPIPTPAPVLSSTSLNEPQPSIQAQTTPDTDSSNVSLPITLPIYGNAVIGEVTPDSEIFGDQTHTTTPPLDLVRQYGGISKLDELNNRDFIDSATNIFTPEEGYGASDPDLRSTVPILLKRGDGAKTGLFYIQANIAYVVEGGSSSDHTTTYPKDPASYYTGGGDGGNHPWKVTYAGSDTPEGAEPVPQWGYKGGDIYTQGTMQTVADGTLSGEGEFVVLSFDRDLDTREIVPASAEVTLKTTVPDSDYNTQYRVLAKVTSEPSPTVLQLQFEEIRIYEELVIENGEIKLQGYEVSHRNNYQPPT